MDLRGARHQGTPTHHPRSVPACAQPHLSRNVRSDALDVLRVLSLVERAGCYRVLSDWQPHSHQNRGTAVARNRRSSPGLRGIQSGDIDAAVEPLDAQIEWSEPVEFPGGGTYQGREGASRP